MRAARVSGPPRTPSPPAPRSVVRTVAVRPAVASPPTALHTPGQSVRSTSPLVESSTRILDTAVVCEPFDVDPSCLLRGAVGDHCNGFYADGPRVFSKVGHNRCALVLSTKGYTSGFTYWEFVDRIPHGSVGFRVGVVPRSASTALNVDGDILDNEGHGAWFTHGVGGVEFEARIGVALDLRYRSGRLLFFVNGEFAHATVEGIPKDRPLYPAFSSPGKQGVELTMCTPTAMMPPDLKRHAEAEGRYAAERGRYGQGQVVLPPARLADSAAQVAQAHTGTTVEVPSHVRDPVEVQLGDALLFVDAAPIEAAESGEWFFEVDDPGVLAQDVFYRHQEYDFQTSEGEQRVVLRIAFKFVCVGVGVTWLRGVLAAERPTTWPPAIKVQVSE